MAGELAVADRKQRGDESEMLHRMICYVRDEAVRLGIMDVATLLEHAEEAVAAFAAPALIATEREASFEQGRRVEH